MKTLKHEWKYTYRSARRDDYSRLQAGRKFAVEVLKSWRLSLGLHPKYRPGGQVR